MRVNEFKGVDFSVKLICQTCKLEITKEVKELEDIGLLNENDRQDYIPEGFFMIGDGEYTIKPKDFIIINLKDIKNSGYHPDLRRQQGCCGSDGSNGMNRICSNNHEIGIEISDCWLPHLVALNPETVKFI